MGYVCKSRRKTWKIQIVNIYFCTEIIQFVEWKGQIYKQLSTEELTIAIKRISDRDGVEKIIHINLEEHLLVIC